MKKKMRQSRSIQKIFILGRPLLVVDQNSQDIRFIPRELIPPGSPAHFLAMEPFTILGISPHASYADISETAGTKAVAWFLVLPDTGEYAREQASLHNAVNILGNRQSCAQFRSFTRSYDQSRKSYSRSKIQRRFAHAIIGNATGLRKRQTIRNIQSGSILGVSLLVSLVMLIVVMTLPVGGVTILGFTLFANTLISAWGPFAIMPIAAVAGLGVLGAYWYKRHKDVFLELQGCLGLVMDHMEAMAYAIEDVFLLDGFRLFQEDSSVFRINKVRIQQDRDAIMSEFVERYVEVFVSRLSSMISERESTARMNAEQLFTFIADHPGEVQQCFQHAFSDLVIKMRAALLQLEAETTIRKVA